MKIFISSGSRLDTRSLVEDLQRLGHEPFVLSEVVELGTQFAAAIRGAIESADAVIVLLGKLQRESSLFEAGIATALGIPMVVIVLDDSIVPSSLSDRPIIRSFDSNLVRDALHAATYKINQRDFGSMEVSLGSTVDQLATVVRFGSEAESLSAIAEAIERSGAIVVSRKEPRGFDLAIWSDDLSSFGANPLFVEFVRSVTPQTLERVATLLGESPTSNLAIVIYREESSSRLLAEDAAGRGYPVIFVSALELLERMRAKSFALVVRDLRNESFHGKSPR
ncbi:toll/interleukin-1 receptor domain-containing protein [Agreia bicolorata]|uniref:Nucleoside 2-deoxyribosyltransferase n=1 Tax=Agreia bicolorata TaxID=110935 RepID=A0ABR5CG64_9MICO|nr:toll/interleukin-1 receptor domain-containing protein [Agreia bicolorata]KJC64653.1 hypothetical protein TZ00_10025 [Agreia bicolorata]